MPVDLTNVALTPLADTAIGASPNWRVEFKIVDATTGQVLDDRTGVNAITFATLLATILPNNPKALRQFRRLVAQFMVDNRKEAARSAEFATIDPLT